MEFFDPNVNNLVGMVSSKQPKTYKPDSGETKVKVIAVDVGMVCAAQDLLQLAHTPPLPFGAWVMAGEG